MNHRIHWGLVFTCIVLGTLALGCLAIGMRAMEAAEDARLAASNAWETAKLAAQLAEQRAAEAERRAAVNRILNCRQLRDIQDVRWVHGLPRRQEPLCIDLDMEKR